MRSSLRSCASCGNSHNEHLLTNKLIKKLRSEAKCVAKLHTELRRATTTHLESGVAIAPLRLNLPHKESIKSYVYADVKPKRCFKKMSLFNTYSRGEITNVRQSLFSNKHWFHY
jgi:hypothetical protein